MSEWQEVSLDSVAQINPTESLRKGTIAKKIAMDALQPFTKRPSSFEVEPYNGGMKFKNGDTIVARITPCLENGKTAYIDSLDENEVAFGSTEYIVLREKLGVSDKQFLYYFSISPIFRDVAIASMTGSSGRQRVQTDVVKQHIFEMPSLAEQKAIASVLSSLDDKIDLVHRQNITLERMAETLFRQWFVEEAQEDWEERPIGDLVKVIDNRGKTPPYTDIPSAYPLIEVNALTGNNRLVDYSVIRKFVDEQTFKTWFRGHPKKYDSLLSTVGSIGEISMFLVEKGSIAQNVIALSAVNICPIYLFEALKYIKDEIKELDIGSVQPSIKVPHLLSLKIKIPSKDRLDNFSKIVKTQLEKMVINYHQIQTLELLRDNLLPKLMSGELRVML